MSTGHRDTGRPAATIRGPRMLCLRDRIAQKEVDVPGVPTQRTVVTPPRRVARAPSTPRIASSAGIRRPFGRGYPGRPCRDGRVRRSGREAACSPAPRPHRVVLLEIRPRSILDCADLVPVRRHHHSAEELAGAAIEQPFGPYEIVPCPVPSQLNGCRSRGSVTSRRPSPARFSARMRNAIARPGTATT